jgi:hypothetical protein
VSDPALKIFPAVGSHPTRGIHSRGIRSSPKSNVYHSLPLSLCTAFCPDLCFCLRGSASVSVAAGVWCCFFSAVLLGFYSSAGCWRKIASVVKEEKQGAENPKTRERRRRRRWRRREKKKRGRRTWGRDSMGQLLCCRAKKKWGQCVEGIQWISCFAVAPRKNG